jgi:hypothetical protein
MGIMLETPFGKIVVTSNGEPIEYETVMLNNIVIGHHNLPVFKVEGRYSIVVDLPRTMNPLSVECQIAFNKPCLKYGINTGERLALKTWEHNELMLSIGTEDEIAGLDVEYLDCGISVLIEKASTVKKVVFSIAWLHISDNETECNYTWFAADPAYAMSEKRGDKDA